jgi:broad specificity phosphatase PhoE
MGTLYLVRHGQASLGADDYDQLSALGQRQSLRLGEYFAARRLRFEAVLMGGMKRHAQTWGGIAAGLRSGADATGMAAAQDVHASVWPGLNEYDSAAVIASVHAGASPRPTSPEAYRAHFRLLRQGLQQWAGGGAAPQGMPRYAEFVQGIVEALDHVRGQHSGNVLLVSSGGPIATAVAQLLGSTPQAFVELNMRLRNTAVSELVFTPKRHTLHTFNT